MEEKKIRNCALLIAKTCALLFAKTSALLIAKKCALLFTDYTKAFKRACKEKILQTLTNKFVTS
jgi:hypothetical protein